MNNVFKIIAVVTGSCNSRNQAANSTPVRFKPPFELNRNLCGVAPKPDCKVAFYIYLCLLQIDA
jgi:hypothetical protein